MILISGLRSLINVTGCNHLPNRNEVNRLIAEMENDYRVRTFSFFLLYGLLGLLLPRHSFLCCLKLCRYNMLCYVAKNQGLLALQHSRAEILSMLFVLLLRRSCDCSAEGTISLS